MERDNVLVLELFHEGDFADSGTGGSFFAVKVDFFEGDKFAGLAVAAFEDLGWVLEGKSNDSWGREVKSGNYRCISAFSELKDVLAGHT